MSCINLFGNTVWSEADIVSHGRTVIASHVSEARQNELRTIMLGHLAGMRTATTEELAEIALVQQVTEQQVLDNAQARSDMERLNAVLGYEAALARLARDPVTEPETVDVTDQDGNTSTVPNPAIAQDAADRAAAQAVVDGASQDTLDLYALRNPPAPEPEPEPVPEVVE